MVSPRTWLRSIIEEKEAGRRGAPCYHTLHTAIIELVCDGLNYLNKVLPPSSEGHKINSCPRKWSNKWLCDR
jgi:hypothetical protein